MAALQAPRHRRAGSLRGVLLALALAGAAVVALPAPSPAAAAGPCEGVVRCRVVGDIDVDGDGTPDQVGIAKRGRDHTPDAWVMVRVRLFDTTLSVARRRLNYWGGAAWQGSAHLDGVRGAELVVGHSSGPQTAFFQVLTWRDGRLVGLRAPDGDTDWTIDSSPEVSSGWLRRPGEHAGTLTQLSAQRLATGQHLGAATRFLWSRGRWRPQAQVLSTSLPDRTAARWGGFHVPGVQRF